jgi:hypothetical protein
LGVFHSLKWPVGVVFIGPNPISSRWIESSSFLSMGAPDRALFTVRCLPRHPLVGVCSSRSLDPTVTLTVRCGLMTVGLADVADADCAAGAPDSPVIYSRNTPNCFQRAVCSPTASLGTRHCLLHTGQSGTPRMVQLLYSNLSSFGMIPST